MPEATVLLRALMMEFRKNLSASSALPADPFIRRPVIALRPWDVVGFRFADRTRPFNKYPHLTVGIDDKKAHVALTLPHQDTLGCWSRLRGASRNQLKNVLAKVARGLRSIRRHVALDIWEPQVHFHLFQRHFHAQRFDTVDGVIRFDLDAALGRQAESRGRAKVVPAWLDAFHTVLAQTARANFELQLRAEYPLRDGSVTRTPEFAQILVRTAEAFQSPLAFLTSADRRS